MERSKLRLLILIVAVTFFHLLVLALYQVNIETNLVLSPTNNSASSIQVNFNDNSKLAKTSPTPVRKMRTAPSQATAASSNGSQTVQVAQDNFVLGLKNLIERNKFYPMSARMLKQKGIVQVSFNLLSDGSITDIKILNSSGHSALDSAAINTIKRIGMYQPIPENYGTAKLNFIQKIQFEI